MASRQRTTSCETKGQREGTRDPQKKGLGFRGFRVWGLGGLGVQGLRVQKEEH